jgi:hypothetical protein
VLGMDRVRTRARNRLYPPKCLLVSVGLKIGGWILRMYDDLQQILAHSCSVNVSEKDKSTSVSSVSVVTQLLSTQQDQGTWVQLAVAVIGVYVHCNVQAGSGPLVVV